MHGHGDPTQFATNHLPQYQGFVECVLTTNNCIYAGESEPYTFFFSEEGSAILGVAGCIHKINRQTMHFLGVMPLFWASAVSKHLFLHSIGRNEHVNIFKFQSLNNGQRFVRVQ